MKPRVCRAKKTASGASEEIVWDIWKANIKKKKRERHDTKQAGWASERQAVAKHSNSQRGRERTRWLDRGRWRERDWSEKALVAMGTHRRHTWVKRAADVGWIVHVHHKNFSSRRVYNVWLREKSKLEESLHNTHKHIKVYSWRPWP